MENILLSKASGCLMFEIHRRFTQKGLKTPIRVENAVQKFFDDNKDAGIVSITDLNKLLNKIKK